VITFVQSKFFKGCFKSGSAFPLALNEEVSHQSSNSYLLLFFRPLFGVVRELKLFWFLRSVFVQTVAVKLFISTAEISVSKEPRVKVAHFRGKFLLFGRKERLRYRRERTAFQFVEVVCLFS